MKKKLKCIIIMDQSFLESLRFYKSLFIYSVNSNTRLHIGYLESLNKQKQRAIKVVYVILAYEENMNTFQITEV